MLYLAQACLRQWGYASQSVCAGPLTDVFKMPYEFSSLFSSHSLSHFSSLLLLVPVFFPPLFLLLPSPLSSLTVGSSLLYSAYSLDWLHFVAAALCIIPSIR